MSPIPGYDYGLLEAAFKIENNSQPVNWNQVFENSNPVNVEIGCGNGHYLIGKALEVPEENFIGIDLKINRIVRCREKQEKYQLRNIRWCTGDAADVLEKLFNENSIQRIYMTFPDPWPKKRHHKRRLFQKGFADLFHSRLKPGGEFIFISDHEEYFIWCTDLVQDDSRFEQIDCETDEFRVSLFGKKWEKENRNFHRFGLLKK